MKIDAKLSISRRSNGMISLSIVDCHSRIEFVDMEITLEEFGNAVTGLSSRPMQGEVRGLEFVGKTRIREDRHIKYPLGKYASRKTMEEWLEANAQEEGWIVDSYLGTQSSIGPDNMLHYSVYKYVPQEEAK